MGKRNQEAIRLKEKTATSFGFEWSKFNKIHNQYEPNFLSYVRPLGKYFFQGKQVLDAGCGSGRHSYFMAKYGAQVTAFDFSPQATLAAVANTNGLPNVTVGQADIYNLPDIWLGKFDIVVCIGVLHHLPDPQEGFRRLVKMLKPGGTISIWVYGTRDNAMARRLYEPVRGLTTRIPHRILYPLALVPATMVEAANRLNLPIFRQYKAFPFNTKWNDSFDVLSAPQSRYYNLEDIREWFTQAGLQDVTVSYRMLEGKAKGIIGKGKWQK